MRQSIPVLLLAALLGLANSACPSDGTDASPGTDALPGTDAGGGTDAATSFTHYGLVWIGDDYGGALAGSIYAGFVADVDLPLTGVGRSPIAGAPGCFQELPPPPAVPNWLVGGTLAFTGLTTDPLSVLPGMEGDYVYNGAGLLGAAGTSIGVDVPGGAIIDGWSATVLTPDPPSGLSFTPDASGDLDINWTAGNGDWIYLRVSTSNGTNACEVPDNGSFTMPSEVFAPDPAPLGGVITFRREIRTNLVSPSGTQELRLTAFVRDDVL